VCVIAGAVTLARMTPAAPVAGGNRKEGRETRTLAGCTVHISRPLIAMNPLAMNAGLTGRAIDLP
jgi:hypothetical protein